MLRLSQLPDLIVTILLLIMGALGGAVSVLSDTEKEPTWRRLIIKSIISGFIGLITGYILISLHFPIELIFALCGMSGLASIEIINLYRREIIKILDSLCRVIGGNNGKKH